LKESRRVEPSEPRNYVTSPEKAVRNGSGRSSVSMQTYSKPMTTYMGPKLQDLFVDIDSTGRGTANRR
jgi:hypothetical protein